MKKNEKILAFIALAMASFLTILDSTIVNVSMPSMAVYYNTDITGVSWISTAYLIAYSALLINFSKIADIFGRKKLYIIGLIVFGAASICCGLATSLTMIISFRIIQGIGAAILTPLIIPLTIELFGKKAMSKLSVVIGMIVAIAAASGPVVGGVLNESFGFKSIFYVNVPFILISLVFSAKYVRECFDKTISKKIDFVGSILLAYGIGAVTFFLVKGNDYGWNSKKIISLEISSIVSIIAFLIYENNCKEPMIEFKLFKVKSFTSSTIIAAITFFAYMPVSYLMNFYLENGLGYSALQAGITLGIISAVSFITAPVYGIITSKTSIRVTSLLAVVFVAAGNFLFVFMNDTNHMKILYSAFIIMGIGIGATAPLYQSAFEEISTDKNGIASGILNSLRQVSACLAIALVATLSTHYTTAAVQNIKDKLVAEVNNSSILEQKVKDTITSKITNTQEDTKSDFSKEAIHNMLMNQEKSVLSTVPVNMKGIVIKKFNSQEKEIYRIADDSKNIKNEETYKVYNKCFLVTGIIAILAIIAVPFNKKNKTAEESIEKNAVSL